MRSSVRCNGILEENDSGAYLLHTLAHDIVINFMVDVKLVKYTSITPGCTVDHRPDVKRKTRCTEKRWNWLISMVCCSLKKRVLPKVYNPWPDVRDDGYYEHVGISPLCQPHFVF